MSKLGHLYYIERAFGSSFSIFQLFMSITRVSPELQEQQRQEEEEEEEDSSSIMYFPESGVSLHSARKACSSDAGSPRVW